MAIYLLIKEHLDTGLKYLCKHSAESAEECDTYKGSGKYWKNHLKKHGNNVSTKCIFVTEDKQKFREVALQYSLKYDVVKSENWANLCLEQGEGGDTVIDKKLHGQKSKEMWKNPIIREKLLKHLTEQVKISQPLAAKAAKEKLKGVPKTEEHKKNMSGKRPHVNQSGSKNNYAKKIETPFGIFGSIREASHSIKGYTYKMVWDRLQNTDGWSYIE